jgi:hypothetical protein
MLSAYHETPKKVTLDKQVVKMADFSSARQRLEIDIIPWQTRGSGVCIGLPLIGRSSNLLA